MSAPTKVFRLFVSSPDDADVERRRVVSVVSRVNGNFAGVARFEAFFYETTFIAAHQHPQQAITPAAECHLVLGILKWKLGTAPGPEFPERLPDGRPYPSGTAYELLTSIHRRRQPGTEFPDVFVFRYDGGPPSVKVTGQSDEAEVRRQWQALSDFIAEWFRAPEGSFKAYFHPYVREDDFEAQVEALLRQWLAEKVAGASAARWPIEINGSPFRGLDAFGAKHAPVFFGRSREVARAVELWREAAERGAPFLLVLGPSGAGKSSFARAGLVPRLTTAGVIETVDEWRVAVMRPGDDPAGPFAALAAAMFVDDKALPTEEEGRAPALPELADSDFQTPADLAAALRHADETAVRPILNALHRIAEATRKREAYARPLRCDLLLLVDQLDELFDPAVDAPARDAFLALLAALVGTGRVWVAATLRDAFYPQVVASPILSGLKARGASLDVAPPGVAELAEIVRAPAEAAGLLYDKDPTSGETLDQRILREADEPGMLPLVQLALTGLFDAREHTEGSVLLTLKAYDGLGGLKGIINEAGETAFAGLREAEKGRLPALIRRLAVAAHGGERGSTLTIRTVPLDVATPDAASRRLVDALVRERLLTTGATDDKTRIVRLAHQRVLQDWGSARAVVADSAEFYRVRADIEEGLRKWEAGKRGEDLLRGLRLGEAERLVARYGDELSSEARAYVNASRARANRAQMIAGAAVAAFGLIAIVAVVAAKIASDQRVVAEAAQAQARRNFDVAKVTINSLVFDIAQGLRHVAGMRTESVRTILETTQKAVDRLTEAAVADPALEYIREAMFIEFAKTYLAADDLSAAASAAENSLNLARKLAEGTPGSAEAQHDVSVSLVEIGRVKLKSGDGPSALLAFEESLGIGRKLAAADSGSAQAQRDLSVSLDGIGDVKLRARDGPGALAAYQESLGIRRKLAAAEPGSAEAQRDVSVILDKVGNVKIGSGDGPGALAAYQESLDIARKLVAADPGSAQAQSDESLSLERIGRVKLKSGDRSGALAAYQESLGIRRKLAAADPGSAEAQSDESVSLDGIGDVKLKSDDRSGALAAYQESLGIRRKLAAAHPGSAQAQRDVWVRLQEVGDVKLRSGDGPGAVAAYQESLDIARKLAVEDAGSSEAQSEQVVSLIKLSVADPLHARASLTEALAIVERLEREHKLTVDQAEWPKDIRDRLAAAPQ